MTSVSVGIGVFLAKLSMLLLYIWLSPDKAHRYTVFGLMAFLVCYMIISGVFQVTTPSFSTLQQAKLFTNVFYGAGNAFMDVCMVLVPMRVIIPLNMDLKKRLAVLLLFAGGAL